MQPGRVWGEISHMAGVAAPRGKKSKYKITPAQAQRDQLLIPGSGS